MWRQVISWTFDFIKGIGDFASWLFTPVNINVISSNASEVQKAMNKSGLANFPTWLSDILANTSTPIYVTPISILSISTLTMLIAIFLIKKIVK